MDPLSPYHEMMSTKELAHFLGVHLDTARREMEAMPHVDLAQGKKGERRNMRVTKAAVRERYGLAESKRDLRCLRGGA